MAAVDRVVTGRTGDPVIYTPGSGPAVEVVGVFDANFVKLDEGTAGMASQWPVVWLILADLPSDPTEDIQATVTIDGVEYRFHEIQPDGLGSVRLLLSEV